MAAIGALAANWDFMIRALVLTSIVGFIMARSLLIWRGQLLDGLRRSARLMVTFGKWGHSSFRPEAAGAAAPSEPSAEKMNVPILRSPAATTPSLTIPYGVAIAIGAMWAWAMYKW
jgi:hypothetical protein